MCEVRTRAIKIVSIFKRDLGCEKDIIYLCILDLTVEMITFFQIIQPELSGLWHFLEAINKPINYLNCSKNQSVTDISYGKNWVSVKSVNRGYTHVSITGLPGRCLLE
jgi:hypothetical protein